jgi:hypothetical protein
MVPQPKGEIYMSSENIQNIVLFAVVLIVFIIITDVMNTIKRQQRCKKYYQLFSSSYGNSDVRSTLESIRDSFRTNTQEYKTLSKAVNYLYFSCLKDYQTAFAIIEDTFSSHDIEILHDEVLEKERGKMILLLEKGGNVR